MEASLASVERNKLERAARRRADTLAVCEDLRAYAGRTGGRFLVFGSVARDEVRPDSDIDILLDFPEAGQADAWRFAEEACGLRDLPFDIKPLEWCRPSFLDRIRPTLIVLS